ncbi:TPA: restriction endonuclease subunit S [Haemophilus influenzae]
MNKQQEPRLRFQGFTGEWEDKKLGELILYLKGFAFKTENYKDSGIRIIRGLDLSAHSIKNNTDSVFIAISEYTKYQDWEIQENDIIITTVGSKPHLIDSAVGRAIFVDKEKIGLLNQNLLILRNIKKETNSFIYANLLTQKFYKYIETIQRGNANQSNITVNDLLDFSLFCPPHKEQTTIGNFFRRLDSQIAESRAVLEKSRQLKKAMLAKMFPANGEKIPKIRFKGFEGGGESRKLGEIGSTFGGLTNKSREDFGHGDARYITYMNVYQNALSSEHQLDSIEIDVKQNEVKKGDVLFTTSSETPEEVGMSSVWTFDINNVYLNSFCFGYRLNKQIDLNYLAYCLRSDYIRSQMILLAQGISRYNISKKGVMEIEILIPTSEEQTAIGNFFRQLDETIALQSAEVEKLNQLKKGLLAAMLV